MFSAGRHRGLVQPPEELLAQVPGSGPQCLPCSSSAVSLCLSTRRGGEHEMQAEMTLLDACRAGLIKTVGSVCGTCEVYITSTGS